MLNARGVRSVSWTAPALFLLTLPGRAAHVELLAERAFDAYIAKIEERLASQHTEASTYIATLNGDGLQRSAAEERLLRGQLELETVGNTPLATPGALLQHWRGAAFVPGAKAKDMLTLLQDYRELPRHYPPQIVSARVLSGAGPDATICVRMKRQQVVTVVLEANYHVQTAMTGDDRGFSSSRSTHVWQVDSPGTATELRRKEGDDDGYLWRLNSYWSFIRKNDGLLIECEAVSLTRDIPPGFGWLVRPVVQDLARTSLEFTLNKTREALTGKIEEAR